MVCMMFASQAMALTVPSSTSPKPVQSKSNNQSYFKNEILVKSIDFIGFVEREEHGITLDALNSIVQKYQLEWGVYLSIAEIHSLADQLTHYYRKAGFNFTKVVVPPQEIVSNTLTLNIVEAVIGDIHIRDADWYSETQIKNALAPLKNKVVTNQQVKQLLDRVNQFPGLKVFGYFSKGSKNNTTRLNIKVQKESIADATLKVDNYGSESTGLYRAIGLVNVNNPFGFADQLQIGVLQTLDIDNQAQEENRFGSLSYRIPIHNSGASLGVSLSNNQFELGQDFSVLGVQGKADIFRVELNIPRSGDSLYASNWSVYMDQKDTTIESDLDTNLLDEDETTKGLGLGYSYQYRSRTSTTRSSRWGYGGLISAYGGNSEIEFGSDTGKTKQEEDFSKLMISQSLYWDYVSNGMTKSRLLLEIKGQYSDDRLPDIETFALSGPSGLRSYESGLFNADKGGVARIQWYWISRYIKPFLFYEGAYGERRSDLEEDDAILRLHATGYGIGFDGFISFGEFPNSGIHCRFTAGQSESVEVNSDDILPDRDELEDKLTVYGELSYRFP